MEPLDRSPHRSPIRSSRTQRWAMGVLIAATSASVALSLNAWADKGGLDGGAEFCPEHMAMHEHEPGAGGEAMMPFAGRRLDRMLSHVDATEAQKKQIRDIANQAAKDLKPLHEEGQALRNQGLALWAAPKLDPQAAEQLRQKMQAHHDQMSKRMLAVMMDIGQVLTPEQRAKLAQHMKAHQARWQGHAGKPGASAAEN